MAAAAAAGAPSGPPGRAGPGPLVRLTGCAGPRPRPRPSRRAARHRPLGRPLRVRAESGPRILRGGHRRELLLPARFLLGHWVLVQPCCPFAGLTSTVKQNNSPAAKMSDATTRPGRALPAEALSGLASSAYRHRILRIPLAELRKGLGISPCRGGVGAFLLAQRCVRRGPMGHGTGLAPSLSGGGLRLPLDPAARSRSRHVRLRLPPGVLRPDRHPGAGSGP